LKSCLSLPKLKKFGYEKRTAYEDSLKVYRDLKNSVDTAREEGEKIGIEKGEKKKAAETAKNLLSMGILTTEQVAQAAGLSAEEVRLMLQELKNDTARR
jgi:predicted transposase/invertase (TIGR01784 family)